MHRLSRTSSLKTHFLQSIAVTLVYCFSTLATTAQAYEIGSRILATGGVSQLEGSAGGGLVPWAVISGYGQKDEWGGKVFASHVVTDDYDASVVGVSVGIENRLELSLATQLFDINTPAKALGLPDNELKMVTAGVKLKIAGDLIYGDLPQISVGAQYKKNTDFDVPPLAGARDDDGVDYYISASRLFLSGIAGYPLLVNTTLRSTKANQLGLLGFGGNLRDRHELVFEGSAGILIRRNLVVGFEYRQKPNNLSFAKEDHWKDVFIGWFPNKHLSIVGAWADLGDIASVKDQDGFYISIEASY